MRFGGGMKCFFGGWDAFWGLSVFSGGCSNAGGTLSAPRNWKNLYVVGPEIWTFAQSAPRKLRIFNLVGANFRTGRKWAPRKLKSLNLVGANFRTGRKWAPQELKSLNLVGLEDLESGRKGCVMKLRWELDYTNINKNFLSG